MKYTRPKVNPTRQVSYARALRDELFKRLGNKCAECPETDPRKLQFDHPNGRDWEPSKLSYSARMKRYEREVNENKVRLLCEPCNLRNRAQHPDGTFYPTANRTVAMGDRNLGAFNYIVP